MKLQLHRGKHLFFKFVGRSRTGVSITVAVLIRDPDAQPGVQMTNISKDIAQVFAWGYNPLHDAAILKTPTVLNRETLGPWLVAKLGLKLHGDTQAFTYEWL
jgi:hypothetical protein